MHEFDLIARYFAPLSNGVLGLRDDAALLDIPEGMQLVITKDAMNEGVHFLGSESPDLIARKLLRTNLSDLAAMGATPLGYFLALMLPANTTEDWIKQFAAGLAADQHEFNIHLLGGDTTKTQGNLSFSITALGTIPKGQALTRAGAQVGDAVFVSGTLGDSALGLSLLKSGQGASEPTLVNRYYLPQPRLALGEALRSIATSAMDVSDGLLQDAGHIAHASAVALHIEQSRIPLSEAVQRLNGLSYALSGGDDYELLFTVSPKNIPQVERIARDLSLPLTPIGEVKKGSGVVLLDAQGQIATIKNKGYRHF